MNQKKYPGVNLEDYQSKNEMKNEDEPLADPKLVPGLKESGWNWDDFRDLKK